MKKMILGLLTATIFSVAGCGGGSGSGSDGNNNMATTNKVIAIVTVVDGNNQSATVGTELPNPLVALIKNSDGQPIAGQTVNFKVTSGGGTVFAGAATSDSSGIVRERWTLGTEAGSQKVEVRAVDSSGAPVVYATFTATGSAAAAQSIDISSGNAQTAQQLQQLPSPIVVIVKDAYGNPVTGVSVSFTANNGGSVQPETSMTNALGQAVATWTLGLPTGNQTLSATVTGLTPVTFIATASQLPLSAATSISKATGDSQTIIQHSQLPQALKAIVTDVHGNPTPNQSVTFTASAGSGYITSTTTNTDTTGSAFWVGYIHTAGLLKIDATAAGVGTVTFNINVTASSHQFDGVYDCSFPISSPRAHRNFTMTITNGVVVLTDPIVGASGNGTLDETSGLMTGGAPDRYFGNTDITAQLVTDSLQRVSGSGTSSTIYGNYGNWTYNRR
ncbi:MAG: Ig-like domain-containing protein [Pelobacteraceae bacterium]